MLGLLPDICKYTCSMECAWFVATAKQTIHGVLRAVEESYDFADGQGFGVCYKCVPTSCSAIRTHYPGLAKFLYDKLQESLRDGLGGGYFAYRYWSLTSSACQLQQYAQAVFTLLGHQFRHAMSLNGAKTATRGMPLVTGRAQQPNETHLNKGLKNRMESLPL